SSSGIGQAAAVEFAKQGASVTIHGRSDEGLKKTQAMLKEAMTPENKVEVVKGALEDETTLKALIDQTLKKFKKIDVLLNNAGISGLRGEAFDSMVNFDFIFNINLKSAVRLALLAVPHLEATKGCIVNVSTVGAVKTSPYAPFYGMAKAALDHFTRNYAVILAPKGIR
ncbi:short-chain dehydrogenease/reductase-like protein, partial [Aphelenchoides avenae]